LKHDLYEILGVGRDASAAQLKTAFRNLAKELHPDHGGDPERFRLVKMAYDVLSDPEARRHYDSTGETHEDRAERELEDGRFKAMAGDFLVNLIAHAAAPEFTNIIALARQQVAEKVAGIDGQVAATKMLAERLATVQSRLSGGTVLPQILAERQIKLVHIIEDLGLQRARWVRLSETLEDYLYDAIVESVP
jgi:curved DNA-binding protein CbpA